MRTQVHIQLHRKNISVVTRQHRELKQPVWRENSLVEDCQYFCEFGCADRP